MKNPIVAFILGFFPGAGLLYLGKVLRGLVYMFGEFFLIGITFFAYFAGAYFEPILAIIALGVILYLISLVDTVVTASKEYQKLRNGNELDEATGRERRSKEQERFYTIILSFVPGLGHFQLGLMNRGMTILASFLGLGIMIFFVAALTGRGAFLVFLAFLPLIWVYGFFDAMQQLGKKEKGEELVDRSILEDFEMRHEEGKKSRAIATFLSIFPGAGHLYLGLQRRGIQLMAAFLFSIYILDILRLGIFLFLIPIIWFYSFFDGMQRASKIGREPVEDAPIIPYSGRYQKWIGIGLIVVGLYYLTTSIIIPALSPTLYKLIDIDLKYWFDRYFQLAVLCILLIGGGIKLLAGKKEKSKPAEDAE